MRAKPEKNRFLRRALVGALFIAACSSALYAQRPFVGRSVGTIRLTKPGWLEWNISSVPGHVDRPTLALPFDVPGQPLDLGHRRIVLPGLQTSTGKGILEIVALELSNSTIRVEQSIDYGSLFDPYFLHWDAVDQVLYVHDFAGQRLLGAPFDGTKLPAPELFAVVATRDQIPILEKADRVRVHAIPGTAGFIVTEYVGMCLTMETWSEWQVVMKGFGTWEITARDPMNFGGGTPMVSVEDRDRLDVLGPIRAWGVRGTVVLVDRIFRTGVLSEATLADDSTLTALPLPEGGLVPGLMYDVYETTRKDSIGAWCMPLVRHGTAQETKLVSMIPGTLPVSGCWHGNGDFALSSGFYAGKQASLPLTLQIHLWIGARRADGTDPVRDWNGTKVLDEVLGALGPQEVRIDSDGLPASAYLEFYIPDEPVLRGAVPLFQWVAVTATGEVAVSDVFGAMITRPWPERSTDYGDGTDAKRSSAATLREAALGPQANPEAARKRFEEIVRSRPRCALTGAKLELLRRMSKHR